MPCLFVLYLYLGFDNEYILFGILFLYTYAFNILDIELCATVKNRKFRTVHLHKTVVDAECEQCRKGMFYGAYTCFAFCEYCTTCCFSNIFCNSINDRLSGKVYSLYLITVVFRSRIECHGKAQACMQSFSKKRKTSVQCLLFVHENTVICFSMFQVLL